MLEWAYLIVSWVSSCFMPWPLPSVNYYSLVPLVPCMFAEPLILGWSLSDLFACYDPSLVLALACFSILWAIVHDCVNWNDLSQTSEFGSHTMCLCYPASTSNNIINLIDIQSPKWPPSSRFQQLHRCEPVVLLCILWCKITSCLLKIPISFCFVRSSRYTASFH